MAWRQWHQCEIEESNKNDEKKAKCAIKSPSEGVKCAFQVTAVSVVGCATWLCVRACSIAHKFGAAKFIEITATTNEQTIDAKWPSRGPVVGIGQITSTDIVDRGLEKQAHRATSQRLQQHREFGNDHRWRPISANQFQYVWTASDDAAVLQSTQIDDIERAQRSCREPVLDFLLFGLGVHPVA